MLRFWGKRVVVAAVGAAGLVASVARAADLPTFNLLGEASIPKFAEKKETIQFGTITLTNAAIGTASFSSSATPFPVLTADAQAGPNLAMDRLFTRGSGFLNYAMMITSSSLPTGSVLPVSAFVAGGVAGTANAGASFVLESSWQIIDVTANLLVGGDSILTATPLTGSFSQGFSHVVNLSLKTDHLYRISLRADAQAAASDPGSSAVAHAFIDPWFSFGAGVDPAQFAFSFSAGIGNTAPVPEPAAAGLLLLGLAVLGWRRRSLQPAGAATASSSSLSMRSCALGC
ncbi:MAG: PEP-CTERM sorting domain-containing protein [Rubrivivax sp.]